MIQKEFKKIIFEFAQNISSFDSVQHIILFGSVARGEADKRSDIDLCVIVDNNKYNKSISNAALDLEKKFDKNIQLVISKNFEKLDEYFIKQLLTEGLLLYGKSPIIKFRNLKCEEQILINFSLHNLKQSEKMQIKRILYGYETKKRYKDKVYKSSFEGLVKKFKGTNVGKGAVLVPLRGIKPIIELFSRYKIKYKKTELLRPLDI